MLLTLSCSDLLAVAPRLLFSFPATYRPFFFPLHYSAHGFGGVMVHECNEYRGNVLPRNMSYPGQNICWLDGKKVPFLYMLCSY